MSLYAVLGVAEDAEPGEIKRAYYDRARLYHPDAHMRSSPAVRLEAERSMQALNEAWTVLRNPAARRRYDREQARAGAETGAAPRNGTAGGGRRTATATRPAPARPELAAGFQYWLGASAAPRVVGGLNLRALGPSLAGLRPLAPDGLAALHAERTAVADRDLEHLRGMRSLRFLDLSSTRVTDAGLVHLLGCTSLEWLVLWDTALTDDGLQLVGRLPALCHLGIGNTAVTDAGLSHLAGLRRLRLLQLWGTGVQGPGLAALHGLPALRTVTLPWRVRGRHRRRLRAALGPGSTVV